MSCPDKNYHYINISGKRFKRLVALYPTKERTARGSVIWHCRCDCGKELDVSYNELMYSNICSCGCQKKEHDAELRQFLTRASGTSLDMLKARRIFRATPRARAEFTVSRAGGWLRSYFSKRPIIWDLILSLTMRWRPEGGPRSFSSKTLCGSTKNGRLGRRSMPSGLRKILLRSRSQRLRTVLRCDICPTRMKMKISKGCTLEI